MVLYFYLKPLLDYLCQDWLKLTNLFWRGLIMFKILKLLDYTDDFES